ncbi:hypothetical protein BH10ACI2_BH10ACI2_05330 [soil metagenome]
MKNRLLDKKEAMSGFSAVELIVVLAVIAILSAISLPYIFNYKKAYKSEDQAFKVIDLMREANQLALTKRRTIRFEIDATDNAVLLIDETGADFQIKKVPMELTKDVRMDIIPTGVSKPNPPNYTDITFATDGVGHLVGVTTVTGHSVWVARFKSDGSMVTNADVPINANIYVWPPISVGSTTPRSKMEVRALTIFGGSGAIRYWKHDGTNFVASQ